MAAPKVSEQQWIEIHTRWISTSDTLRDIGKDFGITEAAIRKRAQKHAWGARNAPERKREMVRAWTAGAIPGSRGAPNPADEGIIREATWDVEAMDTAAKIGRQILDRCQYLLELKRLDKDHKVTDDPALTDPKELKATAEAARAAMEMIRRARNLDEPTPPPPEASPLDALAHALAQARRDRS